MCGWPGAGCWPIETGARRAHDVGFVGHAKWTGMDDEGKLGLEDERGEQELLPAWALAAALVGQGLRLVVLGACESGLSGETRWTGLAQALVRAGVPAVVAMQDRVTEKTLHAFSRVFYTALAGGRPYDVAMNVTRQGLVLDTETPGAWLLPALYMRGGWPRGGDAHRAGSNIGGRAAANPGQFHWSSYHWQASDRQCRQHLIS